MDDDQLREFMRYVLTEQKKQRQNVDELKEAADAAHQRGRTVAVVAMLALLLAAAGLVWMIAATFF